MVNIDLILPVKRVISWSYLLRTAKSVDYGPRVLNKSASALEPIGVEDAFKKLFLPWRAIELGAVNSDGDVRVRNMKSYLHMTL